MQFVYHTLAIHIRNDLQFVFSNQNQESSDATQMPDGDGLSDTCIHKDGNDEERDHAVSIMLFYFFHIGHFFLSK